MAKNEELDETIIGMCTECKTTIPTKIMAKDPFAAAGIAPRCKSCGGVVAIIDSKKDMSNIKDSMDRARNIT